MEEMVQRNGITLDQWKAILAAAGKVGDIVAFKLQGENARPLAVSIPDAGDLAGLSPHTIRWYIRYGKIRPVRFGRRLSIPMSEIERLAQEGIPAQVVAEKEERCESETVAQ